MKLMSQEVELWYIYPSIRKEMSKIMINDYGFKIQYAKLYGKRTQNELRCRSCCPG